jgi:hypothetical protein
MAHHSSTLRMRRGGAESQDIIGRLGSISASKALRNLTRCVAVQHLCSLTWSFSAASAEWQACRVCSVAFDHSGPCTSSME